MIADGLEVAVVGGLLLGPVHRTLGAVDIERHPPVRRSGRSVLDQGRVEPNRSLVPGRCRIAHWPALYDLREFVDAGGPISYGPRLSEELRRTAANVDKILKGAKPATCRSSSPPSTSSSSI